MTKRAIRQGDVLIIDKHMVAAALRELNDSGILEHETSGHSLVVRNMLCAALKAAGVFYKTQPGL